MGRVRTKSGRRRRHALIAGGVVVVLILIAVIGGSFFFSSVLLDPHHNLTKENVAVVSSTATTVTLERTGQSATAGTYGLDWDGGHAIVTAITDSDSTSVTRTVSGVTGTLTAGLKVAIDPDVWEGDPNTARGVGFQNVDVPNPLGPMPAWLIPGQSSTWVLFVHGIDGSRAGGLRVAPTLQQSGMPTLLITYRNDAGAPASPDGLIHLGMTEWQDLDAAAEYAVAHGAQHFVLYGESMGGTIVTRFIHESVHAPLVIGMVLDSPVLNWSGVISGQASRLHVPPLAPPVRWWISARADVSFADLDELTKAPSFTMPILLFQGLSDHLVPPAESQAFAAAVPDGQATYVPVAGAGHIQSWNVDPSTYESTLAGFLAKIKG